jgi:hypothetical protein
MIGFTDGIGRMNGFERLFSILLRLACLLMLSTGFWILTFDFWLLTSEHWLPAIDFGCRIRFLVALMSASSLGFQVVRRLPTGGGRLAFA